MLSAEENQLLTRVGPGTPMGALMRSFWLPALLASELPAADCPPVRVRLLGEDLVAFRDTRRRVGLVGAHCAHRGASLFFGRNEEDGLRCVYHGWKYDVDGHCLDMPNEPLQQKVRQTAYPCEERGGVVWAYLGPTDRTPAMPALEWTRVPETHRYVHKRFQGCNYLQNVEGEVDSSHVSFLHRRFNPDTTLSGQQLLSQATDGSPRFTVKETDYGLLIGARRNWDADSYYWRITQFLAPAFTMIPAEPGYPISFTAAIPADDTTTWGYTVTWRPDRALEAEDVARIESWTGIYAEVDPQTFRPVANRGNDYLIDRAAQRTGSFTGIRGIREQDLAVQEGMGAIYERSAEHLGSSDAAVVAMRLLLLRAVRELQKGIVPLAVRRPEAYAIRSAALLLKRGVPFEEGAGAALSAGC